MNAQTSSGQPIQERRESCSKIFGKAFSGHQNVNVRSTALFTTSLWLNSTIPLLASISPSYLRASPAVIGYPSSASFALHNGKLCELGKGWRAKRSWRKKVTSVFKEVTNNGGNTTERRSNWLTRFQGIDRGTFSTIVFNNVKSLCVCFSRIQSLLLKTLNLFLTWPLCLKILFA